MPELAEKMGVSRKAVESRIPRSLVRQPNGPGTLRLVYMSDLKDSKDGRAAWASILDRLAAENAAA